MTNEEFKKVPANVVALVDYGTAPFKDDWAIPYWKSRVEKKKSRPRWPERFARVFPDGDPMLQETFKISISHHYISSDAVQNIMSHFTGVNMPSYGAGNVGYETRHVDITHTIGNKETDYTVDLEGLNEQDTQRVYNRMILFINALECYHFEDNDTSFKGLVGVVTDDALRTVCREFEFDLEKRGSCHELSNFVISCKNILGIDDICQRMVGESTRIGTNMLTMELLRISRVDEELRNYEIEPLRL